MFKIIKIMVLAGAVVASLAVTGSTRVADTFEGDAIVPPYEEDWQGEGIFDRYVVVDCNEDGRTWGMSNGQVRYSYSSSNAADDWLLTPEILMDSGKIYDFTALAYAVSNSYTERMEICLGQGVDPAAFTQVLVAPTDLDNSFFEELKSTFTVEESGYYRIGFHAISDKNHFYLTLKSWALKVLVEGGAPGVVTDLQVTAGEKGALCATLNFTTPSTTVAGDPLSELEKVDVISEGRVVSTIDHPEPGTSQEVVLTVEKEGFHEFEVYARNAAGTGMSVYARAYIGCDMPLIKGDVECIDLRDGRMTCSWNAAGEVGAHGGYVDTTAVTYQLYSLNDKGVHDELLATTTETCCVTDYDSYDWGVADALKVEVVPVFDKKEGAPASGRLILGKPSNLPYRQSFGISSKDVFWCQEAEGGRWQTSTVAADGDGGCLQFVASDSIARGKACSEKLSLKGAARPMLIFQHATTPGRNLRLHVLIDRQDANGPVLLKTILPDDVENEGWVQEGIDLGDFVDDDYIVPTFLVEADDKDAVCSIDDISVRDVPDCDLELVSVQLPKQVKVGNEEVAFVTVRNNGLMSMGEDAYAVEFSIGDSTSTAGTQVLALTPFNGVATYSFAFTPSIFDGPIIEVTARVVCMEDQDEENNSSSAATSVKQPTVGRMSNLVAEAHGSDVALLWDLPSGMSGQDNIITEYFEDMSVFAPMSVGGVTADNHWGELGYWKLYDGNGTPTRVVEGCDSDSIGAPMAYQVFNAFEAGLDMTDYGVVESMAAYSGEQMLLAMTPADGQPSDKWLVSPLLSGDKQTISIFVSSTAKEPEATTFEVWYSSSTTELERFQMAYQGNVPSTDWYEVKVELPLGARYFAVRSTASGTAGFMVDDITFSASPSIRMALAPPLLTGCHVYRDEVLIAELDADVMEYVDSEVEAGLHTYYVTAVYGDTESGLSNPAVVNVGVDAIPDVAASEVRYGSDIVVYDLQGKLVGHGRERFSALPRGVYIVKDPHTGQVVRVFKR